MTLGAQAEGGVLAPSLSNLERASGVALGAQPGDVLRNLRPEHPSARLALEASVVGALRRTPCVVSFSGGRDSSAVLALATHVARREGLALPVPVTFRFPEVPSTHESDWQELVIRHLGLEEWVRMDLTTELDLLGDISRQCLSTHGLIWPPNAYLHVPLFREARHGSLLTGLDGDGVFGDWKWAHAQSVLHRQTPFEPRDLIRIGFAVAPQPIRRLAIKRRRFFVPQWLQPAAQQEFSAAIVHRASSEPRQFDRRLAWYANGRALYLAVSNLALLAAADDVQVSHPLLDPQFLTAMAVEGGAVGLGGRTAAMRHLFSDLLPEQTIARPSKAEFGRALWREGAREFARSWDGSGVDHDLVRPDQLQEAWAADNPVFHSWTLLHGAWLARQPGA